MIVNQKGLLLVAPIAHMLDQKHKAHGVSHGLSEAGYDIRIKQEVTFVRKGDTYNVPILPKGWGTEPYSPIGYRSKKHKKNTIYVHDGVSVRRFKNTRFCLASAVEYFHMPSALLGRVCDKSTWARTGLSVFNTVIEPGWKGYLTLELVFHGNKSLTIPSFAGIAQVLFEEVQTPIEYQGKYANQEDMPVPPRA